MARYKAAALLLLKKMIKKRGHAHELVFLRMLDPEAASAYQNAEHLKWVEVALAAEIIFAAAQVLYPKDPQALRKLGREEARDNLRGLSRSRAGLVNVAMVLYRLAGLWHHYHDQGKAIVERISGQPEALIVENYPELPEILREVFAGFLLETLELTGQNQFQVRRVEGNPKAWKWVVLGS